MCHVRKHNSWRWSMDVICVLIPTTEGIKNVLLFMCCEKFINIPCFLFFPDFFPFFNFKFIFLKFNFFNTTTSNAHNSANNGARDLLLVSFCREFYPVCHPGINSKPTTWYLFIRTHTYVDIF